ncbi:hypothetical protein L9F63_014646 [Diploptera punctata]|uniref:RRM domain-containing protein n=1 Tax=Diploptera punctata TaxID=6984 RepID=A0AAD8A7H7_DIPPU|nr:hypothetical protein L9F63_014646 [Diploptera punctata]
MSNCTETCEPLISDNITGLDQSIVKNENEDNKATLNEKGDGKDKDSQNIDNPMDNKNQDNPYAYLDRGDFTSEKYKIAIRGLPKFYGIGELKKLLNEKLKLGSNKVKPPARGSYMVYVCFRSEEDRKNALKALDGYVWKSKTLSAEIAKPAPDPLVKRRRDKQVMLKKERQMQKSRNQMTELKKRNLKIQQSLCGMYHMKNKLKRSIMI